MNQWCRSALCGHPLLALTDNLTHGAASRHTIAMPKSATLGLYPVAVATILISRPAEGRWLSWPEHTVEVEVEMDLYSASSLPLPVYVALISVQLGLSQTPANTARPRIRPNVSRGVPVYSPAFAGTQRYKVIVIRWKTNRNSARCYASAAYAVMRCLSVCHVRGFCQNE